MAGAVRHKWLSFGELIHPSARAIASNSTSNQCDACMPPAAEAGSRPGRRPTFLLVQEGGARTRPCCLRPCAALRANLRHPIQSAVRPNSLRALQRFAQTNGRKPDDEATLSCGSVARSLNRAPQAQTQGRGSGNRSGHRDARPGHSAVSYPLCLRSLPEGPQTVERISLAPFLLRGKKGDRQPGRDPASVAGDARRREFRYCLAFTEG